MPIRAIFDAGKRFDGPFLAKLIEDLEANYVLADRAYCSKRNFEAVRGIGAEPMIADNPRKREVTKLSLMNCWSISGICYWAV